MEDSVLRELKKLREIQPDPAYSRRSRIFILNSKIGTKKDGWLMDLISEISTPRLKVVTSAAFTLILITGGVIYYLNQLNQDNIVVRAQKVNATIQVQLDEIKYILESTPLNPSDVPTLQDLLKEASDNLIEASELETDNVDLDKSLEKIKSAEETLLKINELLKK